MQSRLRKLLAKAEDGDVDAQCKLAHAILGRGRPSDYRKAAPWLRRAARADNAWASYHLGLMYDEGLGVRRDRGAAILWYERAAHQGYDSAQLNLGIILANLPGPSRDVRRAVKLYRLAARQGNRNAAYNLGLYYSRGQGVPRSRVMAKRWYQIAAQHGDRDAARAIRAIDRVSNSPLQRVHSRVTPLAGGAQASRHAAHR